MNMSELLSWRFDFAISLLVFAVMVLIKFRKVYLNTHSLIHQQTKKFGGVLHCHYQLLKNNYNDCERNNGTDFMKNTSEKENT